MTNQAFVPFTMTHESITVILDGKPHTIHKGSPQFLPLRQALFSEQWDKIGRFLTVAGALSEYLAGTAFTVDTTTGAIKYDGLDVPPSITKRMQAMSIAGESPVPLLRLYERLAKNPSYRSRTQLHEFMEHVGVPIEPDGTFLAYKGVTEGLLDKHTKQFSNAPGQVHSMPRSYVSDDPDVACHAGFHVGALKYASGFGSRVVICRVDPENVVSVPSDSSFQKMRVCSYEVVGLWGGETMPSTVYTPDTGDDEAIEDDDDEAIDDDSDSDNRHAFEQPDHIVERKPVKPIKVVQAKSNKLGRMTPAKLMECSIDELRKYATHTLKIVGASKLAGGKSALVSAILKGRRKPAKAPTKAKKKR